MKPSKSFLCVCALVFSTAALILSVFANARCNLVRVQTPSGWLGALVDFVTPDTLGLWCLTYLGEEVDLSSFDSDLERSFVAARVFGTLCLCLGVLLYLLLLLAASTARFPAQSLFVTGLLEICNGFFQGLVFLLFQTDVCETLDCRLDRGGICAVLALLCWMVSGSLTIAWATKRQR